MQFLRKCQAHIKSGFSCAHNYCYLTLELEPTAVFQYRENERVHLSIIGILFDFTSFFIVQANNKIVPERGFFPLDIEYMVFAQYNFSNLNFLTPTRCPTIPFNSDTNYYLELVQTP